MPRDYARGAVLLEDLIGWAEVRRGELLLRGKIVSLGEDVSASDDLGAVISSVGYHYDDLNQDGKKLADLIDRRLHELMDR